MLKRPDLEAVAEYYTVKKLKTEQQQLQNVMREVQSRRRGELQRLEDRKMKRELLELRCGKWRLKPLARTAEVLSVESRSPGYEDDTL